MVNEFGGRPDFALVRYEDLRADAPRIFRHLLEPIGVAKVDSGAFEQALTFSSFDNMRQLEASRSFATKIRQPRNPNDPELFKVRKGMIGGFREYLSAESQSYARQVCAGLNSRFCYNAASGTGGRD